ncbi:MAG: hypothetical protein ACLP1Q_09070 [Solirubrobacteraceae bacterium]
MADERYSARGKTVDEILKDFEDHLLDSTYEANTTDYLHAAVTAAAARAQEQAAEAQERWARRATFAAWTSAGAAVAAVIVAFVR